MRLVWFSEVKWSYLTHRHHQLINCFPADWQILFVENFVLGRDNHFRPRRDGRVTYITIPTFKPTNKAILDAVQGIALFRWFFSQIIGLWVKMVFRRTGFGGADRAIVTSNIFFADVISQLASSVKIYDCNDYPMGFPRSLSFTEEYFVKTIRLSDSVVTVTERLKNDVVSFGARNVEVIGNGVDFDLFASSSEPAPDDVHSLSGPIVLYAGVISDWFDFDLVEEAASRFSRAQFVMVGPVISPAVGAFVKDLMKLPNVHFVGMKPHHALPAYIRAAKLCWIPFKQNSLIERFSPNKLYEYTAAGRQVVTMDYTGEIASYSNTISVARSRDELLENLGRELDLDRKEDIFKSFASSHRWRSKADAMSVIVRSARGQNKEVK